MCVTSRISWMWELFVTLYTYNVDEKIQHLEIFLLLHFNDSLIWVSEIFKLNYYVIGPLMQLFDEELN